MAKNMMGGYGRQMPFVGGEAGSAGSGKKAGRKG